MTRSALAVLAAAGAGTRLGCAGPKALVELGGISLVERAVGELIASDVVAGVVITTPVGGVPDFQRVLPSAIAVDAAGLLESDGASAEASASGPAPLAVPQLMCEGGETRQDSVATGLRALPLAARLAGVPLTEETVVLVHDAARCLMPASTIRRLAESVDGRHRAVIPGLPVADTLKSVADSGEAGGQRVSGTPDRSTLRAIQTPQVFTWGVLSRAHREGVGRAPVTDDASLVEAIGVPVDVVEGDPLGFKITTRADLAWARTLLATTST